MKTETLKKIISLIVFCFFIITILNAQCPSAVLPDGNISSKFSDTLPYPNNNFTYIIIDAPNNTFCYNVFSNGILMIHQTSIPAFPGKKGFKTKADAGKVALLVIDKMKKGEMPPSVSMEEMKKLHVIK
jgi:Domain of unknown function (DUF4907)